MGNNFGSFMDPNPPFLQNNPVLMPNNPDFQNQAQVFIPSNAFQNFTEPFGRPPVPMPSNAFQNFTEPFGRPPVPMPNNAFQNFTVFGRPPVSQNNPLNNLSPRFPLNPNMPQIYRGGGRGRNNRFNP